MEKMPHFQEDEKSSFEQDRKDIDISLKNLKNNENLTTEETFRQNAIDTASEHLAKTLSKSENTERIAEAVAFHYLIIKKLCNRLTDTLKELEYSPHRISTVLNTLHNISERDSVSILVLSQKQLNIFFQKHRSDNDAVREILKDFDDANAPKPTIGFHATPEQIQPSSKIRNGRQVTEWTVSGTEKDHRDNDLPMAYYSFDYTHLYRQKKGDFLYIVQTLPSHRSDPSNNWGRAPSLQVISELTFSEIRDYTEKIKQAANLSTKVSDANKETKDAT